VVDAVELALGERPEVPRAGVHLLDAFRNVAFVGVLRLGVVSPAPLKFGRSSLLVLDRQRIDVPAGYDFCISPSCVIIHPGIGAFSMTSRSSSSQFSCVARSERNCGCASISRTVS
jgi:hypothetical protein